MGKKQNLWAVFALGCSFTASNAAESNHSNDIGYDVFGDFFIDDAEEKNTTVVKWSTDICRALCNTDESGEEICQFTAKVNFHASELGYFQFEECGDVDNPTLGMEVGKTYRFIQQDPSNHLHPLGFAYYPDGAHADMDELEPGIVPPGSSSTCDADLTCPAPMYFLGDRYLGTYTNIDSVEKGKNYDGENFGLDVYEPLFFHPLPEWIGYGTFNVYLRFDNETGYDKDLFYFCHIHQYMSGRIKLLNDGVAMQMADTPELGYEYDVPIGHDIDCGTYGLDNFQLPHLECPDRFVCDSESVNGTLRQLSQCIDSMNCAMMAGMTSSVKGSADPTALFIHQMIPHHQNAVNMAKAVIKLGTLQCDDLTDEENPDCAMEVILREITSEQNAQIQTMRGILEAKGLLQENDCSISFNSEAGKRKNKRKTKARTSRKEQTTLVNWEEQTTFDGWGTDICQASCYIDNSGEEICQFTAKVSLHSSEFGYFQFEECGDVNSPTLGIEVGKTYRFIQQDPSNFMHPLGFAYYPDGAHADMDELEPGIVPPGSSSTCDANLTCPAPMYFLGDQYLGSYNMNTEKENVYYDGENFGLDVYEPLFFHPLPEWIGYGTFNVYLRFDNETGYDKDLFYFCHIHQYMSGRIKLLNGGVAIQMTDTPELGYEYDVPIGHDIDCGTYGLDNFQLPHLECPEMFVCDVEGEDEELQHFASCIDSMNCAMMAGMTSSVRGNIDETALFIHQMIPHHQNAVNMAKALIKTGTLQCDDLTDEENPDCAMEVILRSIIAGQNAQIHTMRGILKSKYMPAENDCIVETGSYSENIVSQMLQQSAAPVPKFVSSAFAVAVFLSFLM